MTFRPVIEVQTADGQTMLFQNANQVANYLRENHGVLVSKWQATRLCNGHNYKRAQFILPSGMTITRLNKTPANERNRILHAVRDRYQATIIITEDDSFTVLPDSSPNSPNSPNSASELL